MRLILFLLALYSGAEGFHAISNAKTVMHEIEGLLFWLIAAVLLGSAAIVDAVHSSAKKKSTSEKH